jgi:hypothetical protein
MLSSLMNRSVFEPLVAQLAAQMQGRQEPLAVALLDRERPLPADRTPGRRWGGGWSGRPCGGDVELRVDHGAPG